MNKDKHLLEEKLDQTQEEQNNLRAQHEQALQEIATQIEYYKKNVAELEQEAENLKQQVAINQEQQAQHQQALLTKQQQLNNLNEKIISLINQKMTLEQAISNLSQTYKEWEKTTFAYNPDLLKNLSNNSSFEYKQNNDRYFYSNKPFSVTIKPNLKIDDNNAGNMQYAKALAQIETREAKTINSVKHTINGQVYYYINIYLQKHDNNKIDIWNYDRCITRIENNSGHDLNYFDISFGENAKNISLSPPPVEAINALYIKEQELNKITQELKTIQEQLEQEKEALKVLITQQQPDNTLANEITNKEQHIQKLKQDLNTLELKEQSFKTEINTLKTENKNLREQHTKELSKVKQELDKSREENETLEKEIQAIQANLGDDEKVNQTLLNQLQDKQNKIKGLNEKITLLQEK
ncbi:MAG: hypothetical protein ACQKHC_00340 [Candidatus Phytoplasma pruni]